MSHLLMRSLDEKCVVRQWRGQRESFVVSLLSLWKQSLSFVLADTFSKISNDIYHIINFFCLSSLTLLFFSRLHFFIKMEALAEHRQCGVCLEPFGEQHQPFYIWFTQIRFERSHSKHTQLWSHVLRRMHRRLQQVHKIRILLYFSQFE